MPEIKLSIGAKPYYNIDPISKTLNMADAAYDSFIDEAGSLSRRCGLREWHDTATSSAGRGLYYWQKLDKIIVVTSGKCYMIDRNKVATDISGDVTFLDSDVIFAAGNRLDGSPFLYICDGGRLIYTEGGACQRLTDASGCPANVSSVVWLKSRFILSETDTRKMYATDTNPDTGEIEPDYFLASDNPLTAESSPDNIVRLVADWDEMYVFGGEGIEVWRADNVFFSPIDGAYISAGLAAKHSVCRSDNTLFALCTVDAGSKLAVIKLVERSPQVISLGIERVINSYRTADDAIGWLTNNNEYCLTFPTEGVTWVYNFLSQSWQQFSRWNTLYAKREEFIGRFSVNTWGKILMLSRLNGKIYEFTREVFDDDGIPMRTEYVTGWIDHDSMNHKRNAWVAMKIKTGSTASYITEPVVLVKWRDDGALEWRKELQIDLGLAGQREFIKKIHNLGIYNNRQYSFSMTDNSDMVINALSESSDLLTR